MATETPVAVPDHVTAQPVEKKEYEELKTNETEIVSSPKVEELAPPEVSVVKSEEKAEDKKIDPPAVVEAEKYMDAEKVNDGPGWDVPSGDSSAATKEVGSVEKPIDSPTPELAVEVETKLEEVSEEPKEVVKTESVQEEQEAGKEAEKLAAPEAPVIESEEKIEDKKIDQPAVIEADKYMDAEKVNDGPGWDVPSENSDAATKSTASDILSVSEPAVKALEKKTLTQPEIAIVPEAVVESVENPIDSLPTTEPAHEVETKLEVSEESKELVKPESVVEGQDLGKAAEIPPETKEIETAVSATEETETEKPLEIPASESKVMDLPESVVEVEKPGEQSERAIVPEAVVESVEKPIDSLPTTEPAHKVETKLEVSEESKELVKPESVVEQLDLGKAAEIPPETKEIETAVSAAEETETEKPLEIPASESKVMELPESVVEVEKPGEKSENNEEIEKVSDVKLGQKESNEVEEVTESLPEKEAGENQVAVASESSVAVASEPPSGPVDVEVSVTPDVSYKARGGESEVDVHEESAVAASPKVIKAEEENVKHDEITEPETTINEKVGDAHQSTEITEKHLEEPKESGEVKLEKNDGTESNSAPATAETSFQGQEISKDVDVVAEIKNEIDAEKDVVLESTKTEGKGDLSSALGVDEKSLKGEELSKDLGVVTEEKKEEDVKDSKLASVETSKDADLEGKVGDVKTVDTANETVSKPKELDVEPKATELADTVVDESAKAADVVEETPRELESSKGIDEPKTNEDLSKEVPKKHSQGIMSKVKQSIVKVKKAITGKSPNSKTISSDAKDDIKVK